MGFMDFGLSMLGFIRCKLMEGHVRLHSFVIEGGLEDHGSSSSIYVC